ncbi:fluoride efflux transporter CrcB [Oleiagrimonas sp. C23AA]|uniref:fluoride efflux transporter CrcB n=1 Tax=Oleiagrimonas sp. C23AA TaxID=2719047 RepID=UPI0014216CA7|nr:fluoride efflux transporter CrcB [Oleiagrimonas sp. C23AA]NII11665.1 fluoride efflux transporter CrcB [Oleiagrimonas sp. C23AA]
MGITAIIAVFSGAGLGALLRWWLGVALNHVFPTLPPGTLAANLLGGLIMGCAIAFVAHHQGVPAFWRLFVMTGMLGGLTTFSTFSAEATTLLLRQQYMWFASHVAVHVIGSLAMTVAGLTLTRALLRS